MLKQNKKMRVVAISNIQSVKNSTDRMSCGFAINCKEKQSDRRET
jgi:hypothetical protein